VSNLILPFQHFAQLIQKREKVKHDSDKRNKNETQEKIHHAQKKRACKIIR